MNSVFIEHTLGQDTKTTFLFRWSFDDPLRIEGLKLSNQTFQLNFKLKNF